MIFKNKQNKDAIWSDLSISWPDQGKRKLPMVTVTLVGDSKVGKTSLVRRFQNAKFTHRYKPTSGVDKTQMELSLPNNAKTSKVFFNFLDTNDVFLDFTTVMTVRMDSIYASCCSYVLVVYDISDHRTFEAAKDWVSLARGMIFPDVQMVLVGNKVDKARHREVHQTAGEVFAMLNKMIFVETSAKSGQNVKCLFNYLSCLE